jgi:hypothetical protein
MLDSAKTYHERKNIKTSSLPDCKNGNPTPRPASPEANKVNGQGQEMLPIY